MEVSNPSGLSFHGNLVLKYQEGKTVYTCENQRDASGSLDM